MTRAPIPFFLTLLLGLGPGLAASAQTTGESETPLPAQPILRNAHLPHINAQQSSHYHPPGTSKKDFGSARDALGDTNRPFAFHTDNEQGAWWAVDLGAECILDHVLITNRTDMCQDRAATLQIFVSNSPFTAEQESWRMATKVYPEGLSQAGAFRVLEHKQFGLDEAQTANLMADGMLRGDLGSAIAGMLNVPRWRYLGLRLADKNFLHLKKVEIYGWPGDR